MADERFPLTPMKTPGQSVTTTDHIHQSTDKLDVCPVNSPSTESSQTHTKNSTIHRIDIDPKLLEDDEGRPSHETRTRKNGIAFVLLNDRGFGDENSESPPAEWIYKLPGRALTFSDSFHLRQQMYGHVINPTKGYRFVQWTKSTPKCLPHAGARVASVPKSTPHCSTGTSETAGNVQQTSKTNDTKSDVSISVIPVGPKNTPPSAGDIEKGEVKPQDPVTLNSSTSSGRESRKDVTDKRKAIGQSRSNRQTVYAFAEAFPPGARTIDVQSLGRSEKSWRELEDTVRCHRLKEERLIIRLLRLERLQNLTIEAERKRTNAKRPTLNAVSSTQDRPSSDQPGRRGSRVERSRPMSAYSCRDAIYQRKEALVGEVVERKGLAKGNELTAGRALHGVCTKPIGRYAWL